MKVRIPLVLGDNGHWGASAWGPGGEESMMWDVSYDMVESTHVRTFWIEVELPEPETPVVGGVLKEADDDA